MLVRHQPKQPFILLGCSSVAEQRAVNTNVVRSTRTFPASLVYWGMIVKVANEALTLGVIVRIYVPQPYFSLRRSIIL